MRAGGILVAIVSLVFSSLAFADASAFLGACKNPQAPIETARTVRAILAKAATSDCDRAAAWLDEQTTLALDDADIRDLSPLAGLVNLRDLDLIENRIIDITPLATLVNLESLDIAKNQVFDLEPLRNLFTLECLYARGNRIRDVEPIKDLLRLHVLTLELNPIVRDTKYCPVEVPNHLLDVFCKRYLNISPK